METSKSEKITRKRKVLRITKRKMKQFVFQFLKTKTKICLTKRKLWITKLNDEKEKRYRLSFYSKKLKNTEKIKKKIRIANNKIDWGIGKTIQFVIQIWNIEFKEKFWIPKENCEWWITKSKEKRKILMTEMKMKQYVI